MNSVSLIGRLTSDPALKYLPNGGTGVANFTLAINRELSKDKKAEMESKGQATTDFIRVIVFGKMAENCANYLTKGRLAGVQGRIQTGSYNSNDGSKRYTTDVIASRVEFLEWGNKSGNNSTDNDFTGDGFEPVDDGGDIPF